MCSESNLLYCICQNAQCVINEANDPMVKFVFLVTSSKFMVIKCNEIIVKSGVGIWQDYVKYAAKLL